MPWTAASLYEVIPPGQGPNIEETRAIIDELYDEWCPGEISDVRLIHVWAAERFDTTLEEITHETLKQAVARRISQFKKAFEMVKKFPELKEDCIVTERIERMAKVMRECRNSIQSAAILYSQLDDSRQNSIPEQWNPDNFFKYVEEDEKATTFQRLMLIVLRKLEINELRKLDDMCFKQVIVAKTGERSHAWKQFCTIKEFIYEHIQKETDYEEWKCLTNPHDNCDKVVNHLISSSQIEFPPLVMNRYMWAYNNGLYNVQEDMFWPFRSAHIRTVAEVTVLRVTQLPEHAVRSDDEVLDDDDADIVTDDGVKIWNVDGLSLLPETCFKIGERYFTNFVGREIWPTLAKQMLAFRNGVYFLFLSDVTRAEIVSCVPTIDDISPAPDAALATVVEEGVRVWNISPTGGLDMCTVFEIDGDYYSNIQRGLHFRTVADIVASKVSTLTSIEYAPATPPNVVVDNVEVWLNSKADGVLSAKSVFRENGAYFSNAKEAEIWKQPNGDPYKIIVPTAEDVAVCHFDIDFRFEITPETEASFEPSDIVLPEMELMMNTQELTEDSQEWLVLMLCRLFFPTGYDRWQVVLFIRGIAGSGKSTLAQIIRSFYPPARISTLSSNIEPRFGLSAIYKGLVCICAEVRDDFGLDQAEWQSCVSGEEVQIAVKQKTAFQHKWDTPFFFLGNELPGYQNASGSVDRRFFMIEFKHRVFNSDPHLFDKFMKNIDLFQRKGVTMYHRKLRVHGSKDIWADGVVGEQIMAWKNAVKEQSDALYAFVTSDRFELLSDRYMPLNDFKEAYMEYRRANGHDKVAWKAQHYETVFRGEGLVIKSAQLEWRGITKNQNFLMGIDMKLDDTMDQ